MRLKFIHIPLVIAALFLFSCQKEVSLEKKGPATSATDTMLVMINGVNWVPATITATALSGVLTIAGTGSNGYPSVSFVLPQDIAGVQSLDIGGLTYIGLYAPLPTVVLGSSSGSIQIFENDPVTHRVRGSFGFQATVPLGNSTIGLSNSLSGYFSVEYF